MPKEQQQQHDNDRIPSYEESIAHLESARIVASATTTTTEKSPRGFSSIQERSRLKRVRLVHELTHSKIGPAINKHLEDGVGTTVAILMPSDALPSTTAISASSITSPSLLSPSSSHSNINLLRLQGDDYSSSFLLQPVVVRDLASGIVSTLAASPDLQQQPWGQSEQPSTLPLLPASRSPQPEQPRNTLKYMAGIADSDKDPTGSTGSWNLGWRSEHDPAETATSTIQTEELSVTTRLQDVTFRIENEMGLLESANVKCVWCVVELKG